MIEIKNISANYVKDKKVLNNINFELKEGTLTSLVGPSGCGKTTMLKILAGFIEPSEGVIVADDVDITHLPIQKRGTTMVFQNYALWPHMTIFDNIAYGLRLQKVSADKIEERVNKILDVVEIDKSIVKTRKPVELSGGQQQRIALARALVVEPRILLMDEPLSNLDAKVRQRLRIEIREIQKKLGVTAVYVTHDQEEAMSMSDNVIVMNNGIVAQAGSPQEVYSNPTNSFVAEFLGNSNVLEGELNSNIVTIGNQSFEYDCNINNGKIKVIVRAENIFINTIPDEDYVVLDAEIVGSMYVGTYHRHLVRIENNDIFVDTNIEELEKGCIKAYIPKNKIYVFEA